MIKATLTVILLPYKTLSGDPPKKIHISILHFVKSWNIYYVVFYMNLFVNKMHVCFKQKKKKSPAKEFLAKRDIPIHSFLNFPQKLML